MGTLPGWITAASTTSGVVALVIAFWRRGVSLKGLANANEADLRDHYAQEVEAMRAQLMAMEKHYREMLAQSDRRHEECEEARREMRDELAGLRDQLRLQAANRVIAMEESGTKPSEHVVAAAHRVKRIVEEGGK